MLDGGISQFGAAFRAAEARGVSVQGQRWAVAAVCDIDEDRPTYDDDLLAIRLALDGHESRPADGSQLFGELRSLLRKHPAKDLWVALVTGSRHLLRRDAEECWTMHQRANDTGLKHRVR